MKQTKSIFSATKGRYFLYIFFVLFLFTFFSAFSQKKKNSNLKFTPKEIWEAGVPYIENYTSADYKNSPWNFKIIEGNNGFMYIGNGEGILEYDGNSWDFIPTEHKNWIMTFSKTDNEKIFVGGNQELGYLEPDKLGEMKFHSLRDSLETNYKDFGNIWSTVTIGDNAYFSSPKYLFKWDGKKFTTWKAKKEFGEIFKVNGSLYLNDQSVGLQKLIDDSLKVVSGSEILISNDDKQPERIREMLPYKSNQILIIHSHQGLLLYNGERFEKFNQKSNAILLKSNVYAGVALSNGDYALATLIFGVYIIDGKTGEIKKRLGKKHGLTSNELYAIYEDSNGAIWVCGGEGISKIEWASPFRIFNDLSGLNEIVTSVCYQSGKLLVESNGIYYLTKSDLYTEEKGLVFKKTEGLRAGRLVDIISTKKGIFARNESQVYEISDIYATQLIAEKGSNFSSFIRSDIYDSKFYFATNEKELFDFTLVDNKWITRHLLQADGVITSIVEGSMGNLWLAVQEKGLYFGKYISENSGGQTKFLIKKYDTLSGLPSMSNNSITQFQNKLVVSTEDGYYKFNQIDQTFEKYSLWSGQYNKSNKDFGYEFIDSKGGLWHTTITDDENKVFKVSKNKLSEISEYKLFSDFRLDYLEVMDEIALFVTTNGILMYNENEARSLNRNLSTKLRKVWVNNDSLIYSGASKHKQTKDRFEIPFKNNTLKFEYTLPFYTKSEKNVYQYFLEGFEDGWSSWSTETKKDYTNMPEGNYTFKVRSKNIYDEIGSEDLYSFTILPPWQRTWWAYLIYGMAAITFMVLFSKWRSQELKRKNVALEGVVKERTLEISYKNELLGAQTEKLIEMGKAKTKLYSNITHEFRTPLTVILGMADSLELNVENKSFEGAGKSLEMIHRNGKNLLHLINEMLDLAKSESGNMELQLIQTDVVPLVKYLGESFHSLAEENQINLTIYSEIDELIMDLDLTKLTSILSNVLSNAIKFTAPFGKIIVHINQVVQEEGEYLLIKVKDNGKGIAEEELPNVFNRFYQTDVPVSTQNRGTGIGLALAKELIELMNGTISVKSKLEKGSEFSIEIPVTRNAPTSKDVPTPIKPYISDSDPMFEDIDQVQIDDPELPIVLIIEDNVDVAHYLKICLKETYTTIHAIDGIQGIELALERVPDVIICDVMMPGKDGFEVCATLKSDERTDHIPIIILTAKVTEEDRITGLSHGADAYLPKPFNKKELFVRLDQLVLLRKKLIEKIQNNGFYQFLNKSPEKPEAKFLQKTMAIIHKEMDNSNFGSGELAKKMYLSESQVYRKLKAITDKSTAVFIRSIRLQKAKELITTTDKTISEIAYEVGFNDPSWFSRAFKEEFGLSPSDISK
ncbi:ATP-binding protein [Aquimarina macrocephali]|uniref:ATP-binding protein n=1 Tax=Aquimarina macrocephali TaxID=666563 RepID=UPI003F662E05